MHHGTVTDLELFCYAGSLENGLDVPNRFRNLSNSGFRVCFSTTVAHR